MFPVASSAYSGSYSFDIGASVTGSKKHSLANKSTSTTAYANTYYGSTNKIFSNKDTYKVYLEKGWFSSYGTSNITADGNYYDCSFGILPKGNYVVRIVKTARKTYGAHVRGYGTINQQYAKK